MKSIWKWILGIAGIVVVLAALVAAGYFWQRNTGYAFEARQAPFERGIPGPMHRGYEAYGPMMGGRGFDRYHAPMMGGGSYDYGLPFGGGFFLLGGLMRLIPLAVVALLVFAAYQMGRQAGMNTRAPAEPAGTRKKTS